jgi:hypothetical protein
MNQNEEVRYLDVHEHVQLDDAQLEAWRPLNP